jgi:glycosyltransferase involved in cell wall biosynthesis
MGSELRISCLIPTRNRKRFVARAVAQFLRQDWPNDKELLIVEDGEEDSRDALPADERIHYFRLEGSIGAKLNFAIEQASGAFCARFDDDDWQAPERLTGQYRLLELTGKAVAVCGSVAHYVEASDEAYEFTGDVWAAGGASHFFRRDYAQAHPYPDNSFGEDAEFALAAYERGELAGISGVRWVVAQIHPGNTSPRAFSDPKERDFLLTSDNWRAIRAADLHPIVSQ